MTHSVSHSLILEINGSRLTLLTQRKDGVVLEIKDYQGVSVITLQTILGNLPEIYSNIRCCLRNRDFVVLPEEFYNTDYSEVFGLSYELGINQQFFLDKLEFRTGILYSDDAEIQKVLKTKFPRVKIQHEAGLILSKVYKDLGSKGSGVYLAVNDGSIIIICSKDKKVQLCNQFQAKTVHEIFYFVMLVYEQFHLLPSEDELIILGNPSIKTELNELVKQYIRGITYYSEDYRCESEVTSALSLKQSFAMQLLVCE